MDFDAGMKVCLLLTFIRQCVIANDLRNEFTRKINQTFFSNQFERNISVVK